jgi:hypothetical protein
MLTFWVTVWETRSPPGILLKSPASEEEEGLFALAVLGKVF